MKRVPIKRARKTARSVNNAGLGGGGFRGSSQGSFGYFGSKVVVKNKFIKNNSKQLANHIKYIEHRQQGEKAELFDKENDNVHRYSYDDKVNPHLYPIHHKIMISPEDRLTPDQLKELAREVMLKLENYKQQEIVWIAAIHDKEEHTKYPHLHIVASGKDSVLKIKKKELSFIRKEASRYVTREIGLERAINEKVKAEFKKETAVLDVSTLDKNKADELAKIHNNEKIKEMAGHITITPLDKFNDKKLQKIGSELFISKNKNSYMWIKNGTINILMKDKKLFKSELLALKSEVIAGIKEAKRSLFSGFKDNKTITLKDEKLEQEIIKYNRFKEERRELLSQKYTEPDKILRNKVALESNFNQIKAQLKVIKDRYNSLHGMTDKALHQLIKSSKEVRLSEEIINNIAKREKEYALRNLEYGSYEKHYKSNIIMKTYFYIKEGSVEKGLQKTIDMHKNITGEGEEKFLLGAPLSSDITKKLASIDVESTARNVLKMRTDNLFAGIRSGVLGLAGTQEFTDNSPKEKKEILFETIKGFLEEKNIDLDPVIIRELVKENSSIVSIKEMKGKKFLLEEKQQKGYYLTLNEAVSAFRKAEKIEKSIESADTKKRINFSIDRNEKPNINTIEEVDKGKEAAQRIEKTAKKYVENIYFSIKVSVNESAGDKTLTPIVGKYAAKISTNIEHNVNNAVDKIKNVFQGRTIEVHSQKDGKDKYNITVHSSFKLKAKEIEDMKSNMRDIFFENEKHKRFRDEKIEAMRDFMNAVLDKNTGNLHRQIDPETMRSVDPAMDKTPPIIPNRPSEGIEKELKGDAGRNLNNLDKKIISLYKDDPIRILEHLNDKKNITKNELSEYINGVNFLKNKEKINAEAMVIVKNAIQEMKSEGLIKEKIEEHQTKRLQELGIETTNLSVENFKKTTSNVQDMALENEYNINPIPSKEHQGQKNIGLER